MAQTIFKFGDRANSPISEVIVDTIAELADLNVPTHSVAVCLEDSTVRFLDGLGNWVIFGGTE